MFKLFHPLEPTNTGKNWFGDGNNCHRECGAVLPGVCSMCIDVSEEPASSIIRVHDRVSGPLRNIGTFYQTTWYHILGFHNEKVPLKYLYVSNSVHT